MQTPQTRSIPDHRQEELIDSCRLIFSGLPEVLNSPESAVRGNDSLAQVIMNRVEKITRKPEEMQYCVSAIMFMISKLGKNPLENHELQITREQLKRWKATNLNS